MGEIILKISRRKLIARFFPFIKPHLLHLMIIMLLGVIQLGVTLVGPWMVKVIIDHILVEKEAHWTMGKAMLILGAAFTLGNILQFLRSFMTARLLTDVATDLRSKLYMHLQRLSQRYYDTSQTGSIATRVIQDVEGAQHLISGGVVNLMVDALLAVFGGLMIVYLQWKLALIGLILLPFYYLSFIKFNGGIRRAWMEVHKQLEMISGNLVERISGMKIIQSFNREQHELERFKLQFNQHARMTRFAYLLTNIYGRLNQSLSDAGKLILWFAGAMFVLNGQLTLGGLIAFQAYLSQLYAPINRISAINVTVQNSFAHIERIFEVLDTEPDIRNKAEALPLVSCKGDIRFDNVSFTYASGQLERNFALRNICFHAKPGEVIALVGPSGAGKSTLIQLIPRFYDPDGGKLFIDGLDSKEYDLLDLRKQISLVLQDTVLFSGTIYENISYGNLDATRDQVIAAAMAANVDNFVIEWEQQYETVVGERGMRLSGGQKQRIAIARALLNDPRILILDEATSALDAESEALVTEAMNRLMNGRTTLIIAHRLTTVVRADQILVMDRGEIVEQGRHHELLAKKGLYGDLYEKQLKAMQPGERPLAKVPTQQFS